jgi:hypothetical protein
MPSPATRQRLLLFLAIAVLAAAASATSLRNGFALDDVAIVAANNRVHSLDSWWRLFAQTYWPPQYGASLYRPLAMLGYAIQWTIGDGNPWVFHAVSVTLYVAASSLVLGLFLVLVPAEAAFIGAALFAVHPVHVEAVGNVVGQSELITAIATLGATILYATRRARGGLTAGAIAGIAFLYAVACLTKELGVLMPALLVVVELFAVDREKPEAFRERVRAVAPLVVALGAVAIAYLVARNVVLGDTLGEKHVVPVAGIGRLWVMLAVAPHWVRLLAWPARLSADYSPQQITIPAGPGPEIVLGALVLVLLALTFFTLGRTTSVGVRERQLARAALLWIAITLLPVSNLFSVMVLGGRTLFLPSVGAMLLVAVAAAAGARPLTNIAWAATGRVAASGVVTTLIVLGVIRSSARQRVWRNEETLFRQTVIDAPRSYRAQFFYGQLLFAQGRRAEGERHLSLAIALNPTASDVSPLNYLATEYRDAGMCPQALPLYQRAIVNDESRPDVRFGLAECLLRIGRIEDARRVATDGVRRGDLKQHFVQLVARIDSASVTAAH